MKTSMLVFAFVLAFSGTALAEGAAAPAAPTPASAGATPAQAAPPAAARPRAAARTQRPRGYRSARYSGGQGATWKTGRDSHGFAGSYGGCQYRGHAGPNGYRLDKVC